MCNADSRVIRMCDVDDLANLHEDVKHHIHSATKKLHKETNEAKCIVIPDIEVLALDVCKCSTDLCNIGSSSIASYCSFLLVAAMASLFQP